MSLKLYEENDIQNIADAIREKAQTTDTYKVSQMAEGVRSIQGGGETKTLLHAYELPNIDISLYKNDTLLATKNTGSGGQVEFEVTEIGTYKVQTTSWNREVEVSALNETIEVLAGALENYTKEQIHNACQLGIAHNMWALQDTKTYVDSSSIFNGHKFFIADFISENGKDKIVWADLMNVSGSSYNINPYALYVTSSTATSWASTSSRYSYGGMKYSVMQQRFKVQGEEVYQQATGILPDDYSGSLTTGVKFSELVYTDTQEQCKIYKYSSTDDTMTELSTCLLTTPSNTAMMFVKGYFKSVGQISEETFNNGVYYTYASYVYTKAITYDSSTTYYGLYEFMQEDGVFISALSQWRDILELTERKASAGGSQSSKVSSFSNYANLLAVEEITGLNRSKSLLNGSSAANANAYNLANEGNKLKGFDWGHQVIGTTYWTRSTDSYGSSSFCNINNYGYINDSIVSNAYAVRAGFTTY